MKRILLICAAVVICSHASYGQKLLFNGTFDGWTFGVEGQSYDASKVWQIQDNGELHAMGRGYKQSGMRTNKKYGDYELTLQYKWLTPGLIGNSGIWIHGQDDWSIDKGAFPTSIEVQLRKRYAGDLLRKGLEIDQEEGYRSEGEAVFRRPDHPITENYSEKWNTIKIRCEGDTISVWLNGVFVNKAINCNLGGKPVTQGYITLQAERYNLAFRNISVKSLKQERADGEQGKPVFGTMIDSRDGRVYKTVTIGTQTWMAENFAYETPGSWCYNDIDQYCGVYGRLYSWDDAVSACPEGWRLPSDEEWKTLAEYLGGLELAGEKLKSSTGWELVGDDNYGNNESGFNALPGGYRSHTGVLVNDAGKYGCWWSSTDINQKVAWAYTLEYNNTAVHRCWAAERKDGYSVRYIKD